MGAASNIGRFFTSRVLPLEELRETYKDSDSTLLRLLLARSVASRRTVMGKELVPGELINEECKIGSERFIVVPHLSRFKQNLQASRQIMKEVLSSMDVPEQEHNHILGTIFDAVLAPGPETPSIVFIADVTVRLRSVDEVAFLPDIGRLIIFADALEKVHRDRLEANTESSSCVICMEDFESGGDNRLRLVVRLPCLHLFHGDCIFRWLARTSSKCPLCRYSMPHVYVLSYMIFTHD